MATKDPLLTRVVLETNYKDKDWYLPELAVSYDELVWNDDDPKPTPDDIDSDYQVIVSNQWKTQHVSMRKSLYPSTDELVVALWEKLVEIDGLTSDDIQDLQEKRNAIKTDNPKLTSVNDTLTPLE